MRHAHAMRYSYPATLAPQPEGGFTVTFDDVPQAITEGDDRAEALAAAQDALVAALGFYVDEAKPIPAPSPAQGRPLVAVPALVAAKLALHDAMTGTSGATVSGLARALGIDPKGVRRLLDLDHRSHIGEVEAALAQLGVRIEVAARAA
jgi:antitoxin HicB